MLLANVESAAFPKGCLLCMSNRFYDRAGANEIRHAKGRRGAPEALSRTASRARPPPLPRPKGSSPPDGVRQRGSREAEGMRALGTSLEPDRRIPL
eukprot:CAMPEP_0174365612 /NCGR_PEP_ID=MMETSP0811_2-20130205/77828_1 /TAXON_ID=73025 ORGANISM="Eutreptiella gymnastica-like, Strain CCMP1594" /NCGR_SAMPLE_ID=MMETSP0811_2 /ASSEMBLY_ACC=CAM_ASM_000667 /LENGTH=95 /DNA_ID=CAMNT_0015506373 /DNA_START=66 /DNA_END=353 /DNA_ORIENTATION=+